MTTYKVKPPESLDDFGRWLNEWGDYDQRHERGELSREYHDGYYDAMRDAYEHFTRLNPNWSEGG